MDVRSRMGVRARLDESSRSSLDERSRSSLDERSRLDDKSRLDDRMMDDRMRMFGEKTRSLEGWTKRLDGSRIFYL